jgi:hypothetical protein
MNKQKSTYLYGGIGLAILIALIWYGSSLGVGVAPQSDSGATPVDRVENTAGADNAQDKPDGLTNKVFIANVPFTSQAPTGGWSDPRQQDGCEEASILMAAEWMVGGSIPSTEYALTKMRSLSEMAESMFGSFADSSAADTLKLFRNYTGTTRGVLMYDFTITDIKAELAKGNVVISPMNGQALGNPNFTGAGPERHFLAIIGYDDATGLFTTNDPGTRNGKNYRYTYATLFAAMRDYPTGDHLPITSNHRAMISIGKS